MPAKPAILSVAYAALCACVAFAAGLCAYFFYAQGPLLNLPADIIMWSESDMTGNMIKLLTGAPFYTAPSDSNSMIYTPGASLLTYATLRALGAAVTVPNMRHVQIGFAVAAALLATYNTRLLHRLAFPERRTAYPRTWTVLTFLVTFLAATSPRVNQFVSCLHTDAASLLVAMLMFWAMLRYVERPTRARFVLMGLAPGLGYFFKQFLASWAGAMVGMLFVDQPKNLRRVIVLGALAAGAIGGTMLLCYLLWGDNFLFWGFTVMGGTRKQISLVGAHNISLLRGIDHLLRAWMELGIGVVGGYLLLRGENLRKLGPLWLGWLLVVGSEALSSGAGWDVLYHFGPGVVVGVCWLFAALPGLWPTSDQPGPAGEPVWLTRYVRPVLGVLGVVTVLSALHVVPSRDRNEARYFPPRGVSADLRRYIHDIEQEFAGLPPERVLLDVGNWVYLPKRVLAKDRAVSLGDQPYGHIYDNLNLLVAHIREQRYAKILVHNLHRRDFLYDWFDWEPSSGVRAALLTYYTELRIIPSAKEHGDVPVEGLQFASDVSVLVPRTAL